MATVTEKRVPFKVVSSQQLNKIANKKSSKKIVVTKPKQKAAPKTKIQLTLPVDLSSIPSRNIYTLEEMLSLKPISCDAPKGMDSWPEEVRFGFRKPTTTRYTPQKKAHQSKKAIEYKKEDNERKIIAPSVEEKPKEIPAKAASVQPFVPSASPVKTPIKSNNQQIMQKPLPVLPVLPLDQVTKVPEKAETTNFAPTLKTSPPTKNKSASFENDPRRLEQRQKQIDLGKKTVSYYMYLKKVPKSQRKKIVHPLTPRKHQVCSKRSWDGQVRKWRRMLHDFDPKTKEEITECFQLFPEETSFLVSGQTGIINTLEFYDVL